MTEYGKNNDLTYNSYLKVRELVELQQCLSEPAQHNELLFITVHQTYELWFKQILHEIDAALRWLGEERVFMASRALRRVVEIEHILVTQLRVLETMTPYGFLEFRSHLNPASGFQSSQFREIEFVSGAKDEKLLNHFSKDEHAAPRLQKRFDAATLHDTFFNLLSKRGLDAPNSLASDDEPTRQKAYGKRVRAVVELISNYEQHAELFELQEALIEHDELIATWRARHVLMVERMVGSKPGTGGSEGVGYLKTTLDKKFFPELWEARTYLIIANSENGAGCPFQT